MAQTRTPGRLTETSYGSPTLLREDLWLNALLSISYDASLLRTRQLLLQQIGYEVTSAEGFAEAWDACEAKDAHFDLVILGHSIPAKDKERIIAHISKHCDSPILALARPNELPVKRATRFVEADPDKFIAAVQQMLTPK